MITEQQISGLIDEKIDGTSLFLVDLSISPDNQIKVLLDDLEGMNIKDCVEVSRHIESSLDREAQDFSLTVSSPGLDQSFKVYNQYLKNVGRMIELKDGEDKRHKGELKEVSKGGLVLLSKEMVRLEKKKKKQEVITERIFKFNSDDKSEQIKECRVIVLFK